MPPYQYAPITSPFVGSIAETMQRPAQALAAAEIAKGNAWAQAAQGIGQAASGAIQQATDPRRQLEQQQVDSNKRALAYQTTATKIAQSLVGPNGEQPTPEVASAAMTRLGVPVENQQGILKSLESGATHQKEALADVGHIAYQAMKGLPPTASDDDRAHAASAALGAAMAAGFITPEQSKQVTGMLAQGANPMGMAMSVMGQSPSKRFADIIQDETKPLIVPGAPRPGATPSTVMVGGKTVATGAQPGPAPLTPEQVALDAATLGTPQETPTAKQSAAAVALTHGQKNPPSLEEQYLTAKTNGDDAAAARILGTIKDTAAAKKDPATAALASELAGLRADEAKQRLQKLTEQNKPVDITSNINTTASGKQYVDLSDFQTPESKEKARIAAEAAGVRPVNKDAADGLRAADTARTNLTALLTQIEPYLAKDATGRLLQGPSNTLAKVFQSNPTLGAYGSWRTAAIQAVQALAEKGMGLRLNRSEIDLMLQNDIPQITDDGPTAKQRVQNLFTLLDNKEKGILVRDRSGASDAPKNPFRK